ncbi:MAG: hypothetical protein M3P11_00505 [Actinomycetota bacterium]|nr:hypothetical protein [Actinomycetota bacterium]
MKAKIFMSLVATLAIASADGIALSATASGHRTPEAARCSTLSSGTSTARSSSIAHGRGLIAALGHDLVAIASDGASDRMTAPGGAGVVRHVAARRGVGTAYVLDRRGPDTIVIDTPSGITDLPQPGEAMHPAWSPAGDLVWSLGSRLRIRSHASGHRITDIASPMRRAVVFSPVFATRSRLVVVVSEPPSKGVPEDDALDNLWSYDLARARWTQVTRFTAGVDRWSAIRTPVVASRGVIEFVRIRGSASATVVPAFELWRLQGRSAAMLQALPDERYLADSDATTRVWNVPNRVTGAWRLERDDPSGRRAALGCGAVMVDPLDQPDPDREVRSSAAETRATSTSGPPQEGADDDPEVALLVGDFSSATAASEVADAILATYGAGAPVDVVDSRTARGVVQPGVWATILRLPDGVDAEQALADFRARLPQYSKWSWVVTP